MSVTQTIETLLRNAFNPVQLDITNESHLHQGHTGSPGTGESHFRVFIVSEAFKGKSRVECHRMVNEVLAKEIAGPVHALAIKTATP